MKVEQPSSVVLETRTDIRKLATIHRYFASRGLTITSRSDLLRTLIDVYHGNLLNTSKANEFESIHEAYNYLMSQGIPFGQLGVKGRGKILKALQNEALSEVNLGSDDIDPEKFKDAMKMLKDNG